MLKIRKLKNYESNLQNQDEIILYSINDHLNLI